MSEVIPNFIYQLSNYTESTLSQKLVIESSKQDNANLWWTLDNVSLLASIIASIAVFFTAMFVWKQIAMQSRTVLTDKRRFTRESTTYVFEALQSENFRNARSGMLKALNNNESIPEGQAKLSHFRQVLNTYEMLALSIELDALDENVWKRYWKKTLLRDWERLKAFVEHERTLYKHPTLFEDTEAIVVRWSNAKSA